MSGLYFRVLEKQGEVEEVLEIVAVFRLRYLAGAFLAHYRSSSEVVIFGVDDGTSGRPDSCILLRSYNRLPVLNKGSDSHPWYTQVIL
jgi:hypothetical protein